VIGREGMMKLGVRMMSASGHMMSHRIAVLTMVCDWCNMMNNLLVNSFCNLMWIATMLTVKMLIHWSWTMRCSLMMHRNPMMG